ncbi:sulfite exporter TauE/SafE family protein [Pseudoflavonifractor capillosus]|uniref:sulfite exporter TauE/SafE family protein n=1 Tax=Pseudoflavonifractor capillosus TaxID=106588 RepID=UPI00195A5B04|nr:sulfite exporter TauE/SafE family protein [Pseudoflavonifractor capillosus]MBM6898045.1 sulfite exporter TauE/SafE family protein [Pseudoflavonifractor capillosus]
MGFLVGVATGVLSGCGVGGGTLLMLYLTWCTGMGQYQAGGINLMYFLTCAPPALLGHAKKGLVEWQGVLWCVVTGVPAALGAAAVAGQLEVELLRRLFGVLLLYVGAKELFFRRPSGCSQ